MNGLYFCSLTTMELLLHCVVGWMVSKNTSWIVKIVSLYMYIQLYNNVIIIMTFLLLIIVQIKLNHQVYDTY